MFINKAQLDHLHCNFTIFQAFQENINYCLKPQHYHVVVFEFWVNSYLNPPFEELKNQRRINGFNYRCPLSFMSSVF